MPTVEEAWVTTEDSSQIYSKTWKPSTDPIANLVLVHGFSEHVGRYDRLFTYFTNQGIECYGYDQRGWGETSKKSGQYGDNQKYDIALRDIDNAVIRTKKDNIPLFLLGHSMGGGLVLNYLARGDIYKGVELVTGVIASAPLISLSMHVPAIKYHVIKFMSNIIPSFTIQLAGFGEKGTTHDQKETRRYLADPLIHSYATLATLTSILYAGEDILESKAKLIKTPILYSHGDADPINAYEATAKACELTSSQDKELKNWPGLLHDLHNESLPERQQVTEYYADWIKERVYQYK